MPTRSLQSAQVLLSGILDSAFMRSLQSVIATLVVALKKKSANKYQAAGQLAAVAPLNDPNKNTTLWRTNGEVAWMPLPLFVPLRSSPAAHAADVCTPSD